MRLYDLQREPGRRRGVKRVAALFEDAHADRRASQWVEETARKVPRISGRVVKAGIAVLRAVVLLRWAG